MRYLSVCSGIEAATVAWRPLGWTAHAFAEIEPFPCALLCHYYPDVPNLGDITRFHEWPDAAIDVLVGGTPCQAFSVAGLRSGLADPRGNLALTYLAIAARYRPRWILWENVPGVLSSGKGRDFAAFLAGLGQLGYGWAYRVLDAQYFGLAQRRPRVFVVGSARGWAAAAAVLFERESLSGHPAPRREAGQATPSIPSRSTAGGGLGTDLIARCDTAREGSRLDWETETLIAFDTAQITSKTNRSSPQPGKPCYALAARAYGATIAQTITADMYRSGGATAGNNPNVRNCLISGHAVRRLTPRECERLMGFEDDYTLIPYRGKPASDTPRYKALGNSMAVPVMRWLGERIELVESVRAELEAA